MTKASTWTVTSQAMGKTRSLCAFLNVQHRWRLGDGQVPSRLFSGCSIQCCVSAGLTRKLEQFNKHTFRRRSPLKQQPENQELSNAHVILLAWSYRSLPGSKDGSVELGQQRAFQCGRKVMESGWQDLWERSGQPEPAMLSCAQL